MGLVWDEISKYPCVYRAKIYGGWLVRVENEVIHHIPQQGLESGWDWRPALTFVPDVDHKWKIV